MAPGSGPGLCTRLWHRFLFVISLDTVPPEAFDEADPRHGCWCNTFKAVEGVIMITFSEVVAVLLFASVLYRYINNLLSAHTIAVILTVLIVQPVVVTSGLAFYGVHKKSYLLLLPHMALQVLVMCSVVALYIWKAVALNRKKGVSVVLIDVFALITLLTPVCCFFHTFMTACRYCLERSRHLTLAATTRAATTTARLATQQRRQRQDQTAGMESAQLLPPTSDEADTGRRTSAPPAYDTLPPPSYDHVVHQTSY